MLPNLTAHCQRWREGRASYRPAGEVFNTGRAAVALLDERTAKTFVETHHYSHSMVAARLRVGVFVKPAFGAEFLGGVLVFSVPMSQQVIPATLGLAPHAGVELGRMCLLDSLEANAETWALGQAFRLLRQRLPDVRGVVAYCDPVERRDAQGVLTKRGHLGTIYRAHNAVALGRGAARTLWLLPDGRVASERALSKLRTGETGQDYAERVLRNAGAPQRSPAEPGADWILRLKREEFLTRMAHPGNFRFGWRLRAR
jgi:hypothetical protein